MNLCPVPPRHVMRVGSQIGAGLIEVVVKLEVEVMRLQIDCRNH
jgi:hypothetical protein